jgi:hypothetical protein
MQPLFPIRKAKEAPQGTSPMVFELDNRGGE